MKLSKILRALELLDRERVVKDVIDIGVIKLHDDKSQLIVVYNNEVNAIVRVAIRKGKVIPQ